MAGGLKQVQSNIYDSITFLFIIGIILKYTEIKTQIKVTLENKLISEEKTTSLAPVLEVPTLEVIFCGHRPGNIKKNLWSGHRLNY